MTGPRSATGAAWPWAGRTARLSVRVLDGWSVPHHGGVPPAFSGPRPGPAHGRFVLSGRWNGGGAIYGSDPVATEINAADPFATLDAVPVVEWPPERPTQPAGRPVGGGWFGWFGFEAGRDRPGEVEPAQGPGGLATAYLGFHPNVVRFDAASGRWTDEALLGLIDDAELEHRRRRLVAAVACAQGARTGLPAVPPAEPPAEPRARVDVLASTARRRDHLRAIERCIEHIRAGDIYQANICLSLTGHLHGRPDDLFERLAAALRPAYGAYVEGPGPGRSDRDAGTAHRDAGTALSMSPELFLRRVGREVTSAPIKGTRPRSADATAARAEAERLSTSTKDRAENVMITDLVRNDLSRVAVTGTVAVTSLLRLEAHPGLWHLVSEVTARLRADAGDAELFRATFPPGSVTGAPKIRALEVIEEVEPSRRGLYTGAIGFVSPVAGLEFSVAIRTFEVTGAAVRLGVGGGITAASDPGEEWWECFDKAAPIAAAAGARIEADGPTRPG